MNPQDLKAQLPSLLKSLPDGYATKAAVSAYLNGEGDLQGIVEIFTAIREDEILRKAALARSRCYAAQQDRDYTKTR
jgi:hypothetical protein